MIVPFTFCNKQPKHRLEAKRAAKPLTARPRSSEEKAGYAVKCALAGNVSKACEIVCDDMIPACSDDTIQMLHDLYPERSLDLNLDNLTSPESLNERIGLVLSA